MEYVFEDLAIYGHRLQQPFGLRDGGVFPDGVGENITVDTRG